MPRQSCVQTTSPPSSLLASAASVFPRSSPCWLSRSPRSLPGCVGPESAPWRNRQVITEPGKAPASIRLPRDRSPSQTAVLRPPRRTLSSGLGAGGTVAAESVGKGDGSVPRLPAASCTVHAWFCFSPSPASPRPVYFIPARCFSTVVLRAGLACPASSCSAGPSPRQSDLRGLG